MAGFTILLSDERSPDFGHLGSLGLVEHRQQDHPPAWCEPVRDPRLLALQVKPKFADLASQVARTQADMQDLVENIGHCRHDLSSLAYAVVNLVRGDLVRYLAEERMSARGLQDALGFGSYETAWAWLHKLRRAMVRPERELLSGVVELDQSFLGGRSHGKPGGASEKAPITIAVERLPSGRLGRVRLYLAEMANSLDQVEFARKVIAPGTEIHTDGALVLTRLTDHGFTHHPTAGYLAGDLDAVMPGPHLVSSLLKRWTAGTLHHRISRQHLPYYLDEFTFRFNRRTSRARGLLFYRLLQQAAGTDPHPLSELIGGTGSDWDASTDD
jgi:hypothetical protein